LPSTNAIAMNAAEQRAVAVLAFVLMARLLGLFLLLPVLALHAGGLPGASPALAGLAVGAYGITQALFQFPFGLLSDRYGRKPLIVIGLLVFACGSLLAARAGSITALIAGRALQGAGAVSGAVTALLADLTRLEVRTRAMAIVGISIGAAFMLALLLGPVLAGFIGVRGLFLVAVGLALLAILLVLLALPAVEPEPGRGAPAARAGLAERSLLVLDAGVFLLHLLLTALFVAVPFLLRDSLGLPAREHWAVYFGALALSLLATVPMILAAERDPAAAGGWRLSPLLVALGFALLLGGSQLPLVIAGLALFFAGFNLLEARLPAEISRRADPARRGAALSAFATAQLLGAFAGGAVGGVALAHAGPRAVFAACAALALAGAAVAVAATRRGEAVRA
jgi:MFS family permease